VYRWAKACDTTSTLREITMEIQSTDLKKAIIEATKINPSAATIPSKLSDVVVPVIDVSPAHNRIIDFVSTGAATNNTGATLFTTATDKDFYLTNVSISMIKDVTATSTGSYVSVIMGGSTKTIARIVGITLTVQQGNMVVNFPVPIKLDRGTLVTVNNTTNVANVSALATVYGYYVDNF
jgi:hypothetical protein